MKIAFLADVHAVREALEVCLADAARRGAERLVFLGDLVGYGADPAWVVDTVRREVERGAVALLGNHDSAVVQQLRRRMHADAQEAISWTRGRLDDEQLAFLAGLPLTVEDEDRLYVHANAWSPAWFEYILAAVDARRSLDATRARHTFFGHVHEPALYHQGPTGRVEAFTPVPGVAIPFGMRRRLLANPGAVGQPRDGIPASSYAIYDTATGDLTYHRVPFDIDTAARKISEAGLPEWFGTRLGQGR